MMVEDTAPGEKYPPWWKPSGCPLRRMNPKGPMKGCEKACQVFEPCVELTMRERDYDEWLVKALERLDRLSGQGLNPLQA